MNTYFTENTIRFSTIFKDINGNPVDPATIAIEVLNPRGDVTSYAYGSSAMVRTSQGNYYFDQIVNIAGTWSYKWVGTGLIDTSGEGTINVNTAF